MPSTGLARKPRWRASQRNQPRQALKINASVRGERPLACSSAIERRTSAGSSA
jgi:hypothetical protein